MHICFLQMYYLTEFPASGRKHPRGDICSINGISLLFVRYSSKQFLQKLSSSATNIENFSWLRNLPQGWLVKSPHPKLQDRPIIRRGPAVKNGLVLFYILFLLLCSRFFH